MCNWRLPSQVKPAISSVMMKAQITNLELPQYRNFLCYSYVMEVYITI